MLSGLTNGTSYDVRVRACNSTGCGDWSFSESATPATNPGALPGIPTGLYANGNIVSGEVSIWWQASAGATDYNLRYAVETCTDTPQKTASVCSPGEWNEVNGIATTSKKLSAGSGSANQLTPSTEYRLQVRGTNAYGQSNWSDVAFVYPTSSAPGASRTLGFLPPSSAPVIATAPLYGYQPTNAQGAHEFRYIICDGTIPSGVSINATQIAAAIEKWEKAIKKDSSDNNIVVQTTRDYHHPLTPPEGACEPPSGVLSTGLFPTGKNEVMFVDDRAIDMVRCGTAPACWRSRTWDSVYADSLLGLVGSLPSIAKGTILLNGSRSTGYWNALAHNNACKYVEHTIVHEVGHALGIGWPLNDHPRNPTLSVMSAGYTHHTRYCEPQAYDVVAAMANYQSR